MDIDIEVDIGETEKHLVGKNLENSLKYLGALDETFLNNHGFLERLNTILN